MYKITPTSGGAPYDIQADRYVFDELSGRHLFYKGEGENEELVANLLNVSVVKQPDA
jgi:hypothetical protein